MSELKLLNGDCLDLMNNIPDESVECIITDPPYFSAMQHSGHKTDISDLLITRPFYQGLFEQIKRIITKTGSFYWFCDWETFPFYLSCINDYLPVKNILIWDKLWGRATQYYNFQHEFIIFGTYNSCFPGTKHKSIIPFPGWNCGAKKTNGEKVHPTQKPVELIQLFLSHATKPGDTVLDCFMGSGTTGVACVRDNRNFIGMELQEKYFLIAKERIEKEFQMKIRPNL